MKAFLALFCAIMAGSLLLVTDADAKRLGGGRSFGMQRNITPPRTPTQVAPAPGQGVTPTPAPRSSMSRWLGPIAGLAAGFGLAALFSHLGLGEDFATLAMLLLLAGGAIFLFRMLRRPSQRAGLQFAGGPPRQPETTQAYTAAAPSSASAPATGTIPAGFDSEGFLRQAKVNFVRLQADNDTGNIEDIREFTTPEVFAEIRLDMQERGNSPQQTDIVALNSDLLDVSEEGAHYVASVRFHGSIREQEGAAPLPFEEIWHLTKPKDGSRGWQVAGIQQAG